MTTQQQAVALCMERKHQRAWELLADKVGGSVAMALLETAKKEALENMNPLPTRDEAWLEFRSKLIDAGAPPRVAKKEKTFDSDEGKLGRYWAIWNSGNGWQCVDVLFSTTPH